MKKYIIEGIGTFFLVLIIAFAGTPIAYGVGLIALIYMGMSGSGAHYNPAVSFAMWMRKRMELNDMLMYIVFQFAGALLATLVFHFVFGVNKRFVPAPDLSINPLKPLMMELLFTCMLVLVILHVATSKKTEGNGYFGFAIGFTVMAGAYSASTVSGSAFNPAVGIAPLIIDAVNGGNNLGHAWMYIAGPCTGAILAVQLFRFTNPEDFE